MYKKNSLRWHYERHHINEKFPCNICGKGEFGYCHLPVVVSAPKPMKSVLSSLILTAIILTFTCNATIFTRLVLSRPEFLRDHIAAIHENVKHKCE